jgi:hypothetical protein
MFPVIGKTNSLFIRDPSNPESRILHPEFQYLTDEEVSWTASVKKDGSCGALLFANGKWGVYRRQDIDRKSRNYEHVGNRDNGVLMTISGLPCWATTMLRGTGIHQKYVHAFIFDIQNGELPVNPQHYVAFVAIDPIEDKWVMSAVEDNTDDPTNPYVWISQSVDGSLDVPVVRRTIRDVMGGENLMGGNGLMTVELMCRKFADHYGYEDDRCFLSPHGAEIIPLSAMPTELTLDACKAWFEADAENRWANQEGFVILFSTGQRFKLHRGQVDMEPTWRAKKSCGLVFHYA